jgi:ketosteroid isomerase-like protein
MRNATARPVKTAKYVTSQPSVPTPAMASTRGTIASRGTSSSTQITFEAYPWGRSVRFEPESFIAVSGDRVLVFVRLSVVGGESGIEVEGRFAHLATLRHNRVARVEVYSDREEALEAAGLRE